MGCWIGLLLAGAAWSAEPTGAGRVVLNAQQLQAGGIGFSPLQAVNAAKGAPAAGASLQLSGRVVVPNAARDVILAPVAGRVEAVLVDPGQQVKAGQALLRIRSAEVLSLQREMVAARVRYSLAHSRAERDAQLHAEGIISRNRLLESQAAATEAAAELRECEQLLRLTGFSPNAVARLRSAADIAPVVTLSAQRAGRVLQLTGTVGDAVTSGDPLLHIANLDRLWVELQATRGQAASIATGDAVSVRGCPEAGRVIATALALDAQSQTVAVRAELPRASDCLAPNQFVEASVAPRNASADLLMAPDSAVVQHEGRSYVFVRSATGLVPTVVEVERRAGGSAWLRGSIRAGEVVASAGLAAIKGAWLGIGATAQAQ